MRRDREKNETWARRRWLTFIVGIFVCQAALWGYAITVVASDASHAVVAQYDQRALDWDRHMKRRQRSAALGWSASFAVEPGVSGDTRRIVVELTDAGARPIGEAHVEVTVFHQARASQRSTVALEAEGPGRYAGIAPMKNDGKWRFELVARRGDDELVLERTQLLELGD